MSPTGPRYGDQRLQELFDLLEPTNFSPAEPKLGKSSFKGHASILRKLERRVRVSRLDYSNKNSRINQSEYWGLFNLLFLCVGVYLISEPIHHFFDTNEFIDLSLARLMFEDVLLMFAIWLICFLWSFTAYGLNLAFSHDYISSTALVVGSRVIEICLILGPIIVCFHNEWSILPSGYLFIVATILFMKIHSFNDTMLAFHTLQAYLVRTHPKAFDEAAKRRISTRAFQSGNDLDVYYDLQLLMYCPWMVENQSLDDPSAGECFLRDLNTFPSALQFIQYLFYPVLVYESSYPKTAHFSPSYFCQKLAELFIEMFVLYLVITKYLISITHWSLTFPIYRAFLRLLWPYLACSFLMFFIMFESICNLLAELTFYGDREFYTDWWNSRNWEEFSRKWNRPVHEFLTRHVYYKAVYRSRMSKSAAFFVTLIYSALFHELMFVVAFRAVRFWLSGLMILQIPLIKLGQTFTEKRMGNGCFWLCMMVGMPLLSMLYGRDYLRREILELAMHGGRAV